MKKMSSFSRIIVGVASLALIASYFLPVWAIYLMAPQYPEGLTMNIWLYKITGQVEIINGLNHYIGMKHIKTEMFPEFKYMIYIVAFYILCGLAVAISGNRKWLYGLLGLSVIGGIAAMVDFYLWGYDYGHNLDPTAAIQVPGFSYQPPLIGHKTLLNFDAYSYPDTGGWVIILVAALFFVVAFYEWKKNRSAKKMATVHKKKKAVPAVAALLVFSLASCSTEPEAISYGKDMCDDCKMTIVDEKFGAEIITKKGKVFKFDDAHCVVNFRKQGSVKESDISQYVFVDFENKNKFIDAQSAFFVLSPLFKSPMNSNVAAFSTKAAADTKVSELKGTYLSWNDLINKL